MDASTGLVDNGRDPRLPPKSSPPTTTSVTTTTGPSRRPRRSSSRAAARPSHLDEHLDQHVDDHADVDHDAARLQLREPLRGVRRRQRLSHPRRRGLRVGDGAQGVARAPGRPEPGARPRHVEVEERRRRRPVGLRLPRRRRTPTRSACSIGRAASRPAVSPCRCRRAAPCGARPCWKSVSSGFKYNDPSTAADGVRSMQLKSGAAGRAKANVKGGVPASRCRRSTSTRR